MPYSRKRATAVGRRRAAQIRRAKTGKRRTTRRMKMYRAPRTQQYYTLNKWTSPDIKNMTTNFSTNAATFQLTSVTDYTVYSSLFDQFKILGVVARFRSVTNPDSDYQYNNPLIGNYNNFFLDLYTIVDHDDANTLGDTDAFLSYAKCKHQVLRPDRYSYYRFHPTPNVALAANAGLATVKNTWIDTDYSNAPHYALKWGIKIPGAGVPAANYPIYYEVQYKYHIVFRSPR